MRHWLAGDGAPIAAIAAQQKARVAGCRENWTPKQGTRGFPIRMYGGPEWRNDAILGVLFGAAAAIPAAIGCKTGSQ